MLTGKTRIIIHDKLARSNNSLRVSWIKIVWV